MLVELGGVGEDFHGVHLARRIQETGVDGLLLVTPYYNKCSQLGLLNHYVATADAVDIPCLLYNVPGRTGVNIEPGTVASLAKHPNIVGIKEASGNISQVAEICRVVPADFAVYSGNDDMVVPLMAAACSATLPRIGIRIIPMKASLSPNLSAATSTVATRVSLIKATQAVATARTVTPVDNFHLATSGSASSTAS